MKRLILVAALVLVAAGCHFPQGWHLPRLASNGSSTTQTLVCWQNDVTGYQGPYLAWGASLLNAHPEVAVTMRDTCPATMNRVVWRTRDLAYPNVALTYFGCCLPGGHSNHSLIELDPYVGKGGTIEYSRGVIVHEGLCHAMGGGFGNEVQHRSCNSWPHTSDEISRVYHNDPG